ncbi:MAG TPA: 23S rRNA (adenine(2503)-C(2))-methyltransferase RlmN [Planctomycetaceae bacterium]|nr:23S rRNA (adenine(2503)-C(2))-methyltransferase RlmN [Blastopirellula sp.]HAY80349.1 23S rRNA (adenine(2503)-C(2))-methyltransferase RlmN [Planctomycetaceae bacterium]
MNHLLDFSQEQLADWLGERGHPAYRVKQIWQWLCVRRVSDFESMTNLPQTLREELAGEFVLSTTTVAKHNESADGTEKLVLQLGDGGRIECVLLRDGQRRSICISSQVGCAMGCVFCASGLDGVDRNLTTGEIIEQILLLQRLLPLDERLSHIVVMGMGEPLANLSALLPALDMASSPQGLGISSRKITISTVGLPAAIDQLRDHATLYPLAVSLHAPNDELRNKIVPVNKNIGLTEIMQAADRYFDASGRKLTFEYVLLAEVNDQLQHAEQLARLLRGRNALLNVIPYNTVAGLPYQTPSVGSIKRFREVLEAAGVNVQFRQRKGDDINAACGQLRRQTVVELKTQD